MSRTLKLFMIGLVALSAIALLATSLLFALRWPETFGIQTEIALPLTDSPQVNVLAGVAFWIAVTLFASAMPVQMPRGTVVSVSIAPIVATMVLGGPVAAGWVAAVGTTELRELRGRVPWYGTLVNHAGIVLPALLGAYCLALLPFDRAALLQSLLATMLAAVVFHTANVLITSASVSLRDRLDYRVVALGDTRAYPANLFALAPLAWLMAQVYTSVGGWVTLLFALPLYTTRMSHRQFMNMREMFTQTIGALAEAVDQRDPFTGGHSRNVKNIAVDIGREMRVSESELEALEWGGLLHDVGKIGVPDAVLLKTERLTRDERITMNAHPAKGAEIIAPVTRLAPELPIIRHHHEWFNGSGYPDRLIGDEIPKLARILHVADAFEAMTAQRPYRMIPLTHEQAATELLKFAGIQFDPAVVDAFLRTRWATDQGRAFDEQGGRTSEIAPLTPTPTRPKPVPLISQAADPMTGTSGPGSVSGSSAIS